MTWRERREQAAQDDIRAMFAPFPGGRPPVAGRFEYTTRPLPAGQRALWAHEPGLGGNYVPALDRLVASSKVRRGGVYLAHIAHDDDCLIWRTSYCTCRPDITLMEIKR